MLRIVILLLLSCGFISADSASNKVNWMTNFQEATTLSKADNKPIVLLFTGSDWCVWCIKAEKEIFDTPEFIKAAGDKFIFVKADFPLNVDLPIDTVVQNEKLKNQYGVKGFPTIVIINPEGKALGTVGYSEGGGAKFAAMLLKLSQDNNS